MNSTGQILSVTPADALSTNDTGGVTTPIQNQASMEDKPLKNKEFSSYLDEQHSQQEDGFATAEVASPVLADEGAASLPFISKSSADKVDGKSLPEGGMDLPIAQNAPVISHQPTIPATEKNTAVHSTEALETVAETEWVNPEVVATGEPSTDVASIFVNKVNKSAITDEQTRTLPTDRSSSTSTNMATRSVAAAKAQGEVSVVDRPPIDRPLSVLDSEQNKNVGSEQREAKAPMPMQSTVSPAPQESESKQGLAANSNPTMSLSELKSRFELQSLQPSGQISLGDASAIDTLASEQKQGSLLTAPSTSPSTSVASSSVSKVYQQGAAPQTLQSGVPIEVGKPGWTDAVMGKVMWMSSQQLNSAEIALDPPELGPLQVRITTVQDQTTVAFISNHSVVRDALDQGVARLREMMENQGLDLADVDVSDQSAFQRENTQAEDSDFKHSGGGGGEDDTELAVNSAGDTQASTLVAPIMSLVDQYV
jgi:flagellar hook-length control protein FliK